MIRGEDSDTKDSALDAAGETRQSEPVESSDVGACTIIEVNLHGRPGPRKGDATSCKGGGRSDGCSERWVWDLLVCTDSAVTLHESDCELNQYVMRTWILQN